ncbi:hypothetical protein ABMA28_012639 [Loxostege sticticalis]|uniref:Bromo domain-containing protein n=1 Tax=Loxostege sticticalis TaxID=481309 RepID=A0ABD0S516_LOXSC
MSSIQERLQLKRVPIDTWNIREQLCLASAVVRSGDQNWMSVSRALKTIGEQNRPPDWYSQKSCAAQYGALLEHVDTPKRKKRNSEGAGETPQECILKRLTQERVVEIQKTLAEMNQQYDQLKNEISEVRNPATSEERLRELWAGIEASKRARERENARRAAWLKEREERRARADRTWRPPQPTTPTSPATPAPASSPLLTSLLKSSPVVTTPQHISHPAKVIDTVSPSATAPTLSMLLENSAAPVVQEKLVTQEKHLAQDSKHAAIEHIKSQLQQIEQQLSASSGAPPAPPPAPAVDIDDIEIKAEDVYAFRDIDIHIPPVAHMHKAPARIIDKPAFKKDDSEAVPPPIEEPDVNIEDVIKEEPMSVEAMPETVILTSVESVPEVIPVPEEPSQPQEPPEVKIAFPEVKFPTPEIKVIQDEQKIKEEIKEPEPPAPEAETTVEEIAVDDESQVTVDVERIDPPEELPAPPQPSVESPQPETEDIPLPETIPLPPEPVTQEVVTEETITEPPLPSESEPEQIVEEEIEVESNVEEPIQIKEEQRVEESVVEDDKKDDDAEDSIPLKEMMREESLPVAQEREIEPKGEREIEDAHTETDDDTPMELSREEEKDGKKKRDYSRKKKSDSRTCSGSESAAEASAPDSPSASDAERQHRLWKKSVMLVYSRLCAHKYASLFLRPISDDEAPGYSTVVKRPMDLTAIRRNIESGAIRTTAEFQRDVLLMLSNALMYNSSEHSVYSMAKEMHEEAAGQLGMLLAAQAHAGLSDTPLARRKRRRHDDPTPHKRH